MLDDITAGLIRRWHDEGVPKKTIARDLGISVSTVRRYLDPDRVPPIPRIGEGMTVLRLHAAEVERLFHTLCGNCPAVREEVARLYGVDAGLRTVQRFCKPFRKDLKGPERVRRVTKFDASEVSVKKGRGNRGRVGNC